MGGMSGSEVARIAPSRLIRARGEQAPLTVLCSDDDRMHDFLVVPAALFVPGRLDEDALAAGLAEAIGRSPIWAGRVRSPDGPFDIECDNSGVAFSTAEVELTLREAVAASTTGAPWMVDVIDPVQVRTERAPLLTVRLSRLADGASVLGLCMHHAIGDAVTYMTLFRAWSAAIDGKPMVDPPLIADRAAYLDEHVPPGNDRPSLRQVAAEELAEFRRLLVDDAAKAPVRIHFSGPELERMQKAYSARAGIRLSAINALCGHLMGILRDHDEPGDGSWGVCVPADIRAAAGLEPSLTGNLTSYPTFPFRLGDDPAQLAARVRQAARALAREHIHYHANRRLIASLGGPAALRGMLPAGIDPLHRVLAFNDRSGMGIYEVSFAGQTPAYVAYPSRRNLPWGSHVGQAARRPTGGIAPLVFHSFLPAALAARMSSPEAGALIHAYREANDPPAPDPAWAIPGLL